MIDKTGLDKFYDFPLAFMPELAPEMLDRTSIFDALRQQFRLKKLGPIEYYVNDAAEKPPN